jgi:hypothetical protein
VLKRRGEEVASPNLSIPGEGPILDYLQRGEYSPRWRLLEKVGSYSTIGPLGVISLCGPRKQISYEGYFGIFQNTYN